MKIVFRFDSDDVSADTFNVHVIVAQAQWNRTAALRWTSFAPVIDRRAVYFSYRTSEINTKTDNMMIRIAAFLALLVVACSGKSG